MSGIFGKKKSQRQRQHKQKKKVISRQEQRAEAQETSEMQGAQSRRRLLRSGGMRLLFSPLRQEGPGIDEIKKTLGG